MVLPQRRVKSPPGSPVHKKSECVGFIPAFQKAFLHPRYWLLWFSTGLLFILSWIPVAVRAPLLTGISWLIGKFIKGARRRARINLLYCMPELSNKQREKIIDNMFITAAQSAMLMAELCFRSAQHVLSRIHWHEKSILNDVIGQGRMVILLVPHGWAIDLPAMLLAEEGKPVAGMFNHQRNPVIDYLWNSGRLRFGGRLHSRQSGIRPFISSVRQGYLGYYLPDEDYGEEASEFVDFFATYKATLPVLGRLMKMCRAVVIPLFPVYDNQRHCLDIFVRPPMNDLVDADDACIARRMNEEVEILVRPNPEQYAWVLKLLKTRKSGDIEPYVRNDLF